MGYVCHKLASGMLVFVKTERQCIKVSGKVTELIVGVDRNPNVIAPRREMTGGCSQLSERTNQKTRQRERYRSGNEQHGHGDKSKNEFLFLDEPELMDIREEFTGEQP